MAMVATDGQLVKESQDVLLATDATLVCMAASRTAEGKDAMAVTPIFSILTIRQFAVQSSFIISPSGNRISGSATKLVTRPLLATYTFTYAPSRHSLTGMFTVIAGPPARSTLSAVANPLCALEMLVRSAPYATLTALP
jgi:hypothetical protein